MSKFGKYFIIALCCFSVNTFADDWDVDGNNEADALSDGLLILRYAFGLRGDSLTDGAVSPNSPYSDSEVVSRIENAMSYADIDANGEVDALSDGLIILRYLFGLRGEVLVADTISPDATRTSIEEVVAYLESPNQTPEPPEPPSGEVVPLYNASTALEPETTFTRSDGVIVTRIADRGRDRHHKDSGVQDHYDHYLAHYWQYRTMRIQLEDYVSKGQSLIRVTWITESALGAKEFRVWYSGQNTTGQFWFNPQPFGQQANPNEPGVVSHGSGTWNNDFVKTSSSGLQHKYSLDIVTRWQLGGQIQEPIRTGMNMEFEASMFLLNPPAGSRLNYYGTSFVYKVGSPGVHAFQWQPGQQDGTPIVQSGLSGGGTTLGYNYTNEPAGRFMQMATNMAPGNANAFVLGRRVHHTSFLTGVHGERPDNPIWHEQKNKTDKNFINESCAGCHVRNGKALVADVGGSLDKWVFNVGDQNGEPMSSIGRVLQPGKDSSDTGSNVGSGGGVAELTEAFGGTTIANGSLFTFPSSAEPWAGFANMNTNLYPISISAGSKLTFNASVPSGGSVDVRFRFEKNPHPDVEPSYNTANVTVTGSDTASYSVDLPAQGSNTFRSLIMYVVDRNISVALTDLTVVIGESSDTDSTPSDSGTSEGTVTLGAWTELSNGLRSPNYVFSNGTPPQFSARIAPSIVGVGLLEAVDEETIMSWEDKNDSNNDGISGRASLVEDPETGDLRLGRFGYKAGTFSVKHQIASAFNTDMGVMTSMLPNPDCGSQQTDCGNSGSEVSDENISNLVKYLSLLGVGARRDYTNTTGEDLFEDIGCAGCHRPSMTTSNNHPLTELRGQTIYPYSDLLLHDMGSGLADNLAEGSASGAEWRTTPLWGLGLTKNVMLGDEKGNDLVSLARDYPADLNRIGYLHDGRARTIDEAIRWHGGEGEASKVAYESLNSTQRNAVIEFLESL
jgi:CxxC motif-containing protein (DUF1111 family)